MKEINIWNVQQNLGDIACQLLVINALGGCDTVSAIHGIGKDTVFKRNTKAEWTRDCTDTLQAKDATTEEVLLAGTKLLSLLHNG